MTVMEHDNTAAERQARAWLLHLTSGSATREDGEAFRRWCDASEENALAFARMRRLWEGLGPAAELRRQEHRDRQRAPVKHGVRLSRRAFLGGAIAASLAGVLIVRQGLDVKAATPDADLLRTAVGEQKTVAVAPGVSVELNTNTEVAVRRRGTTVSSLHLRDGEALFTVESSRRDAFVVEAGDGRLFASPGTTFALRCDDDAVTVTCLGGQAVLNRAGGNVLVKPSQQVSFDASATQPAVAVNLDTALAWRNRVLIYDNQPLSAVVADINRYRPGRIVITDSQLAGRRVHARFSLDQMGEIATLIQDAYGAHATHLPGGWVLLS